MQYMLNTAFKNVTLPNKYPTQFPRARHSVPVLQTPGGGGCDAELGRESGRQTHKMMKVARPQKLNRKPHCARTHDCKLEMLHSTTIITSPKAMM